MTVTLPLWLLAMLAIVIGVPALLAIVTIAWLGCAFFQTFVRADGYWQ